MSSDLQVIQVEVVMMASGSSVASVSIGLTDNVGMLKAKIDKASGIPVMYQRLFHGADQLDDELILGKTSVPSSSKVYLVNRGATGVLLEAGVATYDGNNIAEAAQLGALGDVVRLVEEGANISATHDYGYTALHHMAAVPGATGGAYDKMEVAAAVVMMRWLCENGADVNAGDTGGKTPLHVFGKYGGHMDQLQVLVEKRANVNQPMNYGDGWTPLWYCRYYATPIWKEAEAALLELGAEQRPAELNKGDTRTGGTCGIA